MVEFTGSLNRKDLPSFVRALSGLGQTGFLELTESGWRAHLRFRAGRLVSAALGDEHGLAAIVALSLVMEEAQFAFSQGSVPAEDELDLTFEQFGEHFQRVPLRPVLALDAVPNRVSTVASSLAEHQQVLVRRRSLQKLVAIDGRRTVREIVGDAPLAESLRCLADLLDVGLIELDSASAHSGSNHPSVADRSVHFQRVQPIATVFDDDDDDEEDAQELSSPVCPRLGFADGTASHYAKASVLHRCFASARPRSIPQRVQHDFCLSGRYLTCPRLSIELDSGDGEQLRRLPRPRRSHQSVSLGLIGLPAPRPSTAGEPEWRTNPVADPDRWTGHEPAGTQIRADRKGGIPLLPAIAIALTLAAIIAWAYVLARPRFSAESSMRVPTVVLVGEAAPTGTRNLPTPTSSSLPNTSIQTTGPDGSAAAG